MKTIPYIGYTLLFFIVIFALPDSARADHEAMVAGQIVPLADASLSHGENCDDLHYHGELNGVPDPDPDGCGHGVVTILSHDENDESIVLETEEEAEERSGLWNTFTDWLDVAFQGISGGFSPKTVSDSVDIVEDAAPSMRETADNAEEYFDSYDDAPSRERYTLETENPEENSLWPAAYRWFWGFFE